MLAAVHPNVREVASIARVDSASWDDLDHGVSPFLEHGFLRALEESGSVGATTGWEPHYLLCEGSADAPGVGVSEDPDDDPSSELLGAVVAYIKHHSYGEYIFDWAWAEASEQLGARYYPKLVMAAPATPATGRRMLLAPGLSDDLRTQVEVSLLEAVRGLADRERCSSIHWLFVTEDEQKLLSRHGYSPRASFQFHWHNAGYGDYEGFLSALTSRKRKQLRKERRRALEQIDELRFVPGPELGREQVQAMEQFYRRTTARHGGYDYLRPGFFSGLKRYLPHRLTFAEARHAGQICAGAIFLETDRALYGRYWGCAEEREFLHFETAYYAGIERCIDRGLALFEAGAQGEHKLLRGFAPSPTFSAHWIRHPVLSSAVRRYLVEEADAVKRRMSALSTACPYRREV